ncbi:MAG: GGDEF domain-containing protein [Pseudomonadota bacterium]
MNNKMIRNFLQTVNPELLEQFDDFSRTATSPDALRRTHAMTVALLQHAYDLIDQAEQQLESQSQRIESLENLSITDELTGLLNRRGFENAVKRELERLHRGQSKGGAFALLDLDDFKLTNDSHGHYVGDLCLKIVATCLKDMTRTTDVAGRLGGDEFAIYLGNIDEEQAKAKLDLINTHLNRLMLYHQDKTVSIGASLGSIMITDDIDSYITLYDRADQMMYARKSARKSLPNFQFQLRGNSVSLA